MRCWKRRFNFGSEDGGSERKREKGRKVFPKDGVGACQTKFRLLSKMSTISGSISYLIKMLRRALRHTINDLLWRYYSRGCDVLLPFLHNM